MTRFRGMAFALLLATLTVACDGGPTGPSPITPVIPVESQEITITVEAPFPPGRNPRNPGIPGVTVTCTVGCEGQQTDTTDRDGKVTFTGAPPLTIRAEKLGYIPTEQQVSAGDTVLLGNEWPPETAASFRRLQIPTGTILHWGADEGFVPGSTGEYYCPVIMVKSSSRMVMLGILEHELRHAHQSELIPGDCLSISENWGNTLDGREWVVATTADREAGRVIPWLDRPGQYFYDMPHESEAEYYSYWVGSNRPRFQENVDPNGGKSERYKYMEARHGRRPSSYP